MKLKALVMTLAIAAFSVSVAVAAPNKGRDPKTPGATANHGKKPCKGKMLQLSGSYVSGSADASGAGSFAMQVKRGNRAARRLGLVGSQATLNVDARTRYRRHGKAKLGDLQAKDRLVVVARACKAQDSQSSGSDSGSQSGSGSDTPSDPAGAPAVKHGKNQRPNASAPSTPPTLVARLVVAHAPKSSGGDDGSTTGDTGTTSTSSDDTNSVPTTTDGSGS
jgi:hypothetical protein